MKLDSSLLFRYLWLNKSIFYSALVVLCVFAFMPAQETLQANFNDKFLHCAAFAVLSLLFQLAYSKASALSLLVLLAIFGLGIEVVQSFLPHRTFDMLDWVSDLLGIIIYLASVFPLIRKLN